jgi:glycosyltransferase involved in cell wall biosynthesis
MMIKQKPTIMLLGFTVPDDVANKIFSLDSGPAVQTHKFAWSLTRALASASNQVVLASSCPIQNYPLGRQVFFRSGSFESNGFQGHYLGFLNILLIKHVTRLISCFFVLPALMRRKKVDWIFIHGVHSPFLLFGLFSRLLGKKIAVVITDPAGVLLPTDGKISRFLKKCDAAFIGMALRRTDAIVTLAPALISRFSLQQTPALVFPGILDSSFVKQVMLSNVSKSVAQKKFTIIYAGGLHQAYGVDQLIDAILEMPTDLSIQLQLFGRGDQEQRIQQLALNDPRFYYGGFVGNDILIPAMLSADLLINPRPTTADFSLNSFPSKLIEYLATGKPVLTTKISSIPEEYKPYFLYIEKEDSSGIKDALIHAINIPPLEMESMGQKGKMFIQQAASETSVGQKILDLIQP